MASTDPSEVPALTQPTAAPHAVEGARPAAGGAGAGGGV